MFDYSPDWMIRYAWANKFDRGYWRAFGTLHLREWLAAKIAPETYRRLRSSEEMLERLYKGEGDR